MTVTTHEGIPVHVRLKFSLVATMVAAMGLLLVPGAFAQDYPPAEDDFVTCTPDPAAPGSDVECEAGFFQPDSDGDWTVTFSDGEVLSGTFTADGEGVASFAFGVPADASNGAYEVTVAGIGPDGEPKVLAEQNVVADEAAEGARDPGRGRVADTGSDTAAYALGAVVLLGIGGGAVYSTRKKSKASA